MFESLFPSHWSTLKKLMWLKLKGASAVWSTVTGNPVSFTAKAAPLKQLKVAFSPKQDLHGYDSPWPAGGGANKYGGSALKSSLLAVTGATEGSDSNGAFVSIPASTALNDVTLFDGFAENTQYTIILKFLPTGAAVTNVRVYYTDNTYQGFSSSAEGAIETASYTTTAGKTVAAIKLGYWYTTTSKIYYDDCGIFVGANQLFSPYANECPISGWTGVNVWDDPYYAGLIEWNQQIDNSASHYTVGVSPATVSYDTSTKTAHYENNGAASGRLRTTPVGNAQNYHVYAIRAVVNSSKSGNIVIEASKGWIQFIRKAVDADTDAEITAISRTGTSAVAGYFQFFNATVQFGEYSMDVKDLQIFDLTQMFGEAKADEILAMDDPAAYFRAIFPKDYYAYNAGTETTAGAVNGDPGWLVPVVFPDGETYYSGWVDPTTGDGIADMAAVDMGAIGWSKDTANNGFYGSIATGTLLPKGNAYGGGIAEEYKPAQYPQVKGKSFNACFNIATTTHYIYLYDSTQEAATAAEFKTHVTGQKLVYELAEPIPFHVDPQQINSLAGANTMWTDADTLTAEYRSR